MKTHAATPRAYADQRYYASTYGRFNTADPSTASAGPSDPVSWNRYSYTGGDPINRSDPQGLDWIYDGSGWCSTLDPSGGCYDPEGGDPSGCYQLAAMAWMNYPGYEQECGSGAPIIPVQQSSPPQVTCSLEVESFPLITFGGHGPDLHGSLDFTASIGSTVAAQDVIEGFTDDSGLLQAAVTPGNTGPVGNLAGTGTNDGTITGPQVCGAFATLEADVATINGANIKYNRFGPNSNSALRYMLLSLLSQLGSSWYSIPSTRVGYYAPLPGVNSPVRGPGKFPHPVLRNSPL